jgi:hypothetical protein
LIGSIAKVEDPEMMIDELNRRQAELRALKGKPGSQHEAGGGGNPKSCADGRVRPSCVVEEGTGTG